MMSRAFGIFLTLLLPLFVFSQKAQPYLPPKFQNLSLRDGLSNMSVHSVCQDDLGYIWIATARGLNRYDGLSFRQYFFKNDSVSLYHNMINTLHKNHEGILFCGTSNGVNRYDPIKEKFSRTEPENKAVVDFCEYRKKTYASNLTGGLSVYVKEDNTMASVSAIPENIILGPLIALENSGLWSLSPRNKALFHFKPEQNLYDKYVLPSSASPDLKGAMARVNRYLMISTGNDIFLFDPENLAFVPLPEQWNRLGSIAENEVNFISEIEENILWIGTKERGLFIFDMNNNTFMNFSRTGGRYYLPSNHLTSLFKDNTGNIWMGTFDRGLEIAFEKRKNFNFDQTLTDFTENKFITSIVSDENNIYYLGTRSEGLYVYDSNNRQTSVWNAANSFLENHVRNLTMDSRGRLWISSLKKLFIYDPRTRKHQTVELPSPNNGIVSFCESEDYMLCGTDICGLLIFTKEGKLVKQTKKMGANITQVLNQKENTFILSSYGWGIYRYNLEKDSVTDLSAPVKNAPAGFDEIITCYLDSKEDLWIGNFKYGLYRLKEGSDTLEVFTMEDGLPSNDITSITEDNNGTLWISTAYGLARFTARQDFRSYAYNEGLENIQFHQKAVYVDDRGTVFFGGNLGLTFFNPKSLGGEKKEAPRIILESLKVSNKEVKPEDKTGILSKNIHLTKKITLDHHHPIFSIEYKGFDYIAAQNLRYAYKLEGFDEKWNFVDQRKFASYSNLDPGDYTFKVKARNNTGTWSPKPAELNITIRPAPWKTQWAMLGYVLLIAGAVIGSFQLILKAKLFKKELELEHKERVRENEISKMKIRFFNNISHEIRTPLTLLKGNVDYLTTELSGKNIRLSSVESLKNSTDRLLRLVNQLLMFRKLETDTLQLEIREEDILEITRVMVDSCIYTSQIKQVDIRIDTAFPELVIPLDRDKYEKIMSNLIYNALKHTRQKGYIKIAIEKLSKEAIKGSFGIEPANQEYVLISVTNSGKGIPKSRLSTIFDRFTHYNTSGSKPDYSGTGIGLDFSKRLVELHNGAISVSSTENRETCFCFILPAKKSAYPPDVWEKFDAAIEKREKDSPAPGPVVAPPESSNGAKRTVLIAEDDIDLNQFIQKALAENFKVIPAFNGKEALKLIKNQMPDLIISDIMMPEMDGIRLCASVKKNENIAHIPLLLLTAKAEVENKITGFNCGADDYITKPFDIQMLKARVCNLIKQRTMLQKYYKNAMPADFIKDNVSPHEFNFIKKINKIIEGHYASSDFNVHSLAKEMNMSRTSFYRKFMSMTNVPPKEYLTRYRINKAIEMIKNGNESFGEISYLCGFNSQSIFSVIFKKEKGMTPLQYKNSLSRNQAAAKDPREKIPVNEKY